MHQSFFLSPSPSCQLCSSPVGAATYTTVPTTFVAKVGRGQVVSAVVISGVLLALVAGAIIVMVSSGASVVSIIQGL